MFRAIAVLAFLAVHLGAVAQVFDPWTQSARYELEYRADLADVLASASGGIRVWLPLPANTVHQKLLSVRAEAPWPCQETQDQLGNRYVYVEPVAKDAKRTEVVLKVVVQRSVSKGIESSSAKLDTPNDPRRYLSSQRRIPLEGKLTELATEASRGCETDAQKIRAFYDYVTGTLRYSKDGDGWGRGDALWACDAKYGNCTDFHSVFIGMARAAGIPARFEMGFPFPADKTEGDVKGYHCWAEAYDSEHGWIPVDASEAWKAKRFDDYFGTLPSDRVEFTTGRDLVLEPPQKGDPLNFFIYPYAEVNGKPVEKVAWKLHFRRLTEPSASE